MIEPYLSSILARHGITPTQISRGAGSSPRSIYLVNNEFVVRCSTTPMEDEIGKLTRAADVPCVPELLHTGRLDDDEATVHYSVLRQMPGTDVIMAYREMSTDDLVRVGAGTAAFLDALHQVRGQAYDIGHYVPTVPEFTGSWRDGHQRYTEVLSAGASKLRLTGGSAAVVAEALGRLQSLSGALSFQGGPRLLHNDLHPANIIVKGGRLSGVIDWECSQFGEADFELSHLVHWCAFPPEVGMDLTPMIESVFRRRPFCTQVPDLEHRLTLYQLEHDLNQLIWHGTGEEENRVSRLRDWLDGRVADMLSGLVS
jgi:aminoglycoside phosphotransferase (APT) family kinase protein